MGPALFAGGLYMPRQGTGTNEATESRGRLLCLVDSNRFYYTSVFNIGSFSANVWVGLRDIYYLFPKHHQKPHGQQSIMQCANMTSVKCVKSGNTINPLFNSQRIWCTDVHSSCSLVFPPFAKEVSDRPVRAPSVLSSWGQDSLAMWPVSEIITFKHSGKIGSQSSTPFLASIICQKLAPVRNDTG